MGSTAARVALGKQMARVGQGILVDHLTRRRPTTLDEVPPFASSITTEWLTAAVCAGTSVRVVSVAHESVSSGTSDRGRLIPVYEGPAHEIAGLPVTIFIKSTSTFVTRLHVGANGGATGEVRFYRDIGPTIDVEAPKGYFGAADRKSGRSIILMEDLAKIDGLEFGDCRSPLTRAQAEGLVDTLAGVHGSMIESPRFDSDLRWVKRTIDVQNVLNTFVDWEKRTVVGLDRIADQMPPELLQRRDELHHDFMYSLSLDDRAPRGLVHSDVHAGNWYRLPDDRMGLFDWSAYSRGRGTRDVGYALMSSLAVEDRRAWERELLARYTDRLSSVSGRAHDVDDVWLSYRQQLLHGLVYWLTTIGRSAIQPKMQSDEISTTNLTRMAQAVVDLDTFEALGRA
jgi:aminoglycoside phosphotransferase (APT) family kinase protein